MAFASITANRSSSVNPRPAPWWPSEPRQRGARVTAVCGSVRMPRSSMISRGTAVRSAKDDLAVPCSVAWRGPRSRFAAAEPTPSARGGGETARSDRRRNERASEQVQRQGERRRVGWQWAIATARSDGGA